MKKFLVLFNAPAEVMAEWSNSSPEDKKKGMDEWMAWMEENKGNFVDPGNPVGKNKRVMKDDSSDIKNEVGGYAIIQAESQEEAVKMMSTSPHFNSSPEGVYIELMEIIEMKG